MGEVSVVIDGRSYGIACDAGQEQRVQQLGRYVDQRLKEIANGSGTNNKSQLMVLTALLLADEVFDLKEHMSRATNANAQPKQVVYQGLAPAEEKEISEAISKLAAKVETLSKKVKKV